MRSSKLLLPAILCVLLLAAPRAFAQCAGFSDVASGGFCEHVTWLKNRQITLGCTATTYCPNDPVTRLAMAAFMNRIGNILTPAILEAEDSGGALEITTFPSFLCQTEALPVASYPRTMHANLSLSFEVTGVQDVLIGIARATGNGPFAAVSHTATLGDLGQRHHHHYTSPQPEELAPGDSYRFAVAVARTDPGSNSIATWSCQLQVHVINALE
jgi:hypothetical protein